MRLVSLVSGLTKVHGRRRGLRGCGGGAPRRTAQVLVDAMQYQGSTLRIQLLHNCSPADVMYAIGVYIGVYADVMYGYARVL